MVGRWDFLKADRPDIMGAMRPIPLLTLVLVSSACARERDPAPTEMVDIVRFMFANWEDEEPVAEAFDNLLPWLGDNAHTEEAEDGFRLEPLTTEDVASVERPQRDLALLLGAAGGALSVFPIDEHAATIVLEDQTWSNPSQYKVYVRDVVGGNEREFVGGSGLVRTSNAIETSNWGVSIPYVLFKDYRWVETESGRGIVARSWVEDRSCNDGGGNCLEQSFSIDLWAVDGQETIRLTSTWSEVTSSIPLGEDTLIAGLALGIQNVFRATDKYLEEN